MTYSDNELIYIPTITAVKMIPPHLCRLQCNSHHIIIITTKSLELAVHQTIPPPNRGAGLQD